MTTLIGDIIRVSARQMVNDRDEVVNVHHFQLLSSPLLDVDVLDEVGGKMSEAWSEIASKICNNQQANIIDVYNVSQDYPLGQVPWGAAYSGGTATGEMMPAGAALLVLWRTAAKRVQGKTYLGVFTDVALGDGLWEAPIVTDVDAYTDALQSAAPVVDATSIRLRVYSRGSGVTHNITSRTIVLNPAYQRRRRFGRGS